jgi:hypothetical protein
MVEMSVVTEITSHYLNLRDRNIVAMQPISYFRPGFFPITSSIAKRVSGFWVETLW